MVNCWAAGCSNRSESGVQVFPFPKDLLLKQSWTLKVNRLDPSSDRRNPTVLEPTLSSKLCEKHFENECFTVTKTGKRHLKDGAIPTVFAHKRPRSDTDVKRSERAIKRSRSSEMRIPAASTSHNSQDEIAIGLHENLSDPNTNLESADSELAQLKTRNTELLKKLKQARREKNGVELKLVQHQQRLRQMFNEDQLAAMSRRSTRGMKWELATVKRCLALKFSCGTTGYSDLIAMGMPLPSVRTLQGRLQTIPFAPGILESVFTYLFTKVQKLCERDRLAVLTLDEMEIKQATEYDPSSQQVLGGITLPGSSGDANHALVFMLGGIAERWKQVVSYHFTGRSMPADSLKTLVQSIIERAASIGIRVMAVTSDMGPSNQAMWRKFGIYSHKDLRVTFADILGNQVHFMADVPHLVKNLATGFLTHRTLTLPASIVTQFSLQSNIVNLKHVEDLVILQSSSHLKLTPNLSMDDLSNRSHFKKMNVGKALHLFSNSVSAGLTYLVEKEGRPKTYEATAWFIKLVDSWFNLMSSRHPVMALSKKKLDAFESATGLLKTFIQVLEGLQIGPNAAWKPVQTGMCLSTTSVLNICEELLGDKLDFLLTARLTQDCIENLFSVVRSKNPVPTPREFKYALKIICTAQYLKEVKSSNYQMDDREYLGDLLPQEIIPPNEDSAVLQLVLENVPELSNAEQESLYYLAGYTVQSLLKLRQLCIICTAGLKHTDEENPHPYSTYLKMKNFKDGALFEVSQLIYVEFLKWEKIIRELQLNLKSSSISKIMKTRCLAASNNYNSRPVACQHDVIQRMVPKYVTLRIHILCKKASNEMKDSSNIRFGSRSMAAQDLVSKLKIN